MATIPGSTVKHAIVTDVCRQNRTDEGAVDEALSRLRKDALECIEGWRDKPGMQLHFVLTLERPSP